MMHSLNEFQPTMDRIGTVSMLLAIVMARFLNWMRTVLLHVTFVQKNVLSTMLHLMIGFQPTMDTIGPVRML